MHTPTSTTLGSLSLALFLPALARADGPDAVEPVLHDDPPGWEQKVVGEDLAAPTGPVSQNPWIIFLNFDGGADGGRQVLPFTGDSALRANIAQKMRVDMAPFNMICTDRRPPAGYDYDTEMIGDLASGAPGGSVIGFSPTIDCGNNGGTDVSYTFEHLGGTPDGATNGSQTIAHTVLQELSHSWGLEHVNAPNDLLHPLYMGRDCAFLDQCFETVSDTELSPSGGRCTNMHQQSCGANNMQNSYGELMILFGERTYVSSAPTVDITEPAEGATIGADFDLVVAMNDELSPQILTLTVNLDGTDALKMKYYQWDLRFPVQGLPDGPHTMTVSIVDEDGMMGSDQVSFTVAGGGASTSTSSTTDPTTTSSTTDPTTTSSTTDPTTTSSTTDPTTTSSSTGGEDDGGDEGSDDDGSASGLTGTTTTGMPEDKTCACRSDRGLGAETFLGLPLLLVRRRRR